MQDDERQATPENAHEVFKDVGAPAFPEQDLTDGVGSTSVPVYGLDSWNQELQALSPLGSFASPSAVSMELTDISQEYEEFSQHEDTNNSYTGTSVDRAPSGMSTYSFLCPLECLLCLISLASQCDASVTHITGCHKQLLLQSTLLHSDMQSEF